MGRPSSYAPCQVEPLARPSAPLVGRQHINSLKCPDVNHPIAVTTAGFNHNWRADVNRRD